MHIVIFAGQSRPPDTFPSPNPPTKKAPPQTLKLLLNFSSTPIFHSFFSLILVYLPTFMVEL